SPRHSSNEFGSALGLTKWLISFVRFPPRLRPNDIRLRTRFNETGLFTVASSCRPSYRPGSPPYRRKHPPYRIMHLRYLPPNPRLPLEVLPPRDTPPEPPTEPPREPAEPV